MKTSRLIMSAVVVVSFILLGLPAFGGEKTPQDTEAMYIRAIDKEIGKCQEKTKLKNSRSANLQREGSIAIMKASFLKDYKQELLAEMRREDIGSKDYQISNFLNEKFYDVFNPILAGGQHHAASMIGAKK